MIATALGQAAHARDIECCCALVLRAPIDSKQVHETESRLQLPNPLLDSESILLCPGFGNAYRQDERALDKVSMAILQSVL